MSSVSKTKNLSQNRHKICCHVCVCAEQNIFVKNINENKNSAMIEADNLRILKKIMKEKSKNPLFTETRTHFMMKLL